MYILKYKKVILICILKCKSVFLHGQSIIKNDGNHRITAPY